MRMDSSDATPGTRRFTLPAVAGFLLVVPFIILELLNADDAIEQFPVVLFGFMWLLGFCLVLIGRPVFETWGTDARPGPLGLTARIVTVIVIAVFWSGLVLDQMPCFLGVPNCD